MTDEVVYEITYKAHLISIAYSFESNSNRLRIKMIIYAKHQNRLKRNELD